MQAPVVQPGVPLFELHAVAHVPQCVGSVCSEPSQPSLTRPLQFPQPAAQAVMEQALPEHDDVAWFVLQASAQPPQFKALVPVLVSQPLTKLLSQSPIGAVQAMPQVPLLHDGLPPLALQTLTHVPQWVSSFFRSASQPLLTTPSQLAKPAKQLMPQAPPAQLAVPWVVLHTVEQVLQWSGSVPRFVSQPLDAKPSQFPKPAAQVMPQELPEQVGVPLVELQATPQPPQFGAEEVVLVSQPLTTLPSQLP